MNKIRLFFYLLPFFVLSCNVTTQESSEDKTPNAQVKNQDTQTESSFEKYKNEISKELNITRIEYLGSLQLLNNIEIIIVKGLKRTNYYEETNLYLYSNDTSSYLDTINGLKYSVPGNQYDIEGDLIFSSKVYYGNLSNSEVPAILWYQRELINGSFKESIFLIEFTKETIEMKKIYSNQAILDIIGKVKDSDFAEVKSSTTYSEP